MARYWPSQVDRLTREGTKMPKKAKTENRDNLREIPGRPGLYDVIPITHDPKKEKTLMAKIELAQPLVRRAEAL